MKSSRKLGDFYYGVSVWRRGYELPQSDPVGFVAAIHMIGYPITSCIWPFLCVFLRISVLFPIGRESAWMPMRAGFIPQKVLIISVKAQSPEGSDKMKKGTCKAAGTANVLYVLQGPVYSEMDHSAARYFDCGPPCGSCAAQGKRIKIWPYGNDTTNIPLRENLLRKRERFSSGRDRPGKIVIISPPAVL